MSKDGIQFVAHFYHILTSSCSYCMFDITFQDKELKTTIKNPTVFIMVIGLSGVQFGLQS